LIEVLDVAPSGVADRTGNIDLKSQRCHSFTSPLLIIRVIKGADGQSPASLIRPVFCCDSGFSCFGAGEIGRQPPGFPSKENIFCSL